MPSSNPLWSVKLINKGRTIIVTVPAYTQAKARKTAEHQYPEYKAIIAQRI
jgi:hypothetical protein